MPHYLTPMSSITTLTKCCLTGRAPRRPKRKYPPCPEEDTACTEAGSASPEDSTRSEEDSPCPQEDASGPQDDASGAEEDSLEADPSAVKEEPDVESDVESDPGSDDGVSPRRTYVSAGTQTDRPPCGAQVKSEPEDDCDPEPPAEPEGDSDPEPQTDPEDDSDPEPPADSSPEPPCGRLDPYEAALAVVGKCDEPDPCMMRPPGVRCVRRSLKRKRCAKPGGTAKCPKQEGADGPGTESPQ